MGENPKNYNLLVEQWIPVLYRDGRWQRVGIRKALRDAGEIREVRDSSPLVTFGIYRLLIAVLKWLGTSAQKQDWNRLLGESALPVGLLGQLDQPENEKVFDLRNPAHPFFQDAKEFADLPALVTAADERKLTKTEREKRKLKTVAYLATEIPTKTYKAHFWHANDETTQLCTACCVCGLLTLPPFCTGVGQGNETSINNVPPVYWLVHSERLLDTLLLNLPDGESEGDAPCWVRSQAANHIGALEGMTWEARRVAIYPNEVAVGRCSRCGEPATATNPLVHWIIFAKRATKKADDAWLATWIDPHVAGTFEKKKDRTRFVGQAADVAPGAWCRRVQSLFTPSEDNRTRQSPNMAALASRSCVPGRCEAVAYMLRSKKADFEYWQEERWPISPALVKEPSLCEPIISAAKQAGLIIRFLSEEWPECLWRLRYSDRNPNRNGMKSLRKGCAAAAIRSAVDEFDQRLESWFRTQMGAIADGGSPDVRADLPTVCREAGHSAVASIVASLSAARSPLDRARIEQSATELIEGAVRKMERAIGKGGRKKT